MFRLKPWRCGLLLAALLAAAQAQAAGLLHRTLMHDGRQRSYYLYLPDGRPPAAGAPLLLVLHGGGGSGRGIAGRLGFQPLADRAGFLLVYPEARGRHWNDGRVWSGNPGTDDVGFLSALIDRLLARYRLDPARVYVSGVSNGGMMTLRLGCEVSGKLAAIAPAIANLPQPLAAECRHAPPLSLLLLDGTADPLVPWRGGGVGFGGRRGEVLSTAATVALWVRRDGCNALPRVEVLPDRDADDRSRVRRERYGGCRGDTAVELYAVEGGGHTWPGARSWLPGWLVGPTNRDIDGARVAWDFLMAHRRRGSESP